VQKCRVSAAAREDAVEFGYSIVTAAASTFVSNKKHDSRWNVNVGMSWQECGGSGEIIVVLLSSHGAAVDTGARSAAAAAVLHLAAFLRLLLS
jgi:NAD(P)H-hydrate repair Nnr-like enzyme with NAD(P)H-hydrate dehydratase domain